MKKPTVGPDGYYTEYLEDLNFEEDWPVGLWRMNVEEYTHTN